MANGSFLLITASHFISTEALEHELQRERNEKAELEKPFAPRTTTEGWGGMGRPEAT